MIPAEGFPGRRFVLPKRNVRPMSEVRPSPPQPWPDRVFSLVFDYNRSFAVYQLDDYLLDQAITWIRAVKPRQIIITGHAATNPSQVSGQALAEKPGMAGARAEFAAESLRRLGVDPAIIVVHTQLAAQPAPVEGADGLVEPSRRRVDIDVRR
jgi:outer membrane protein OmpA-like peptidoglycan-associated protein